MDEFLVSCKVAKFLNIPYIIVVTPLKSERYSVALMKHGIIRRDIVHLFIKHYQT